MKLKTLNTRTWAIVALFFASAILAGCSNTPSQSKDGYLLRMNLNKGDSYPIAMAMRMTVSQEGGPISGDIKMNLSSAFKYKVTDVSDTLYTIDLSYEEMDMAMEMMGQSMTFSSANQTEGDMVSQLLNVMTENNMQMVMSDKGAVVEVKNMDGYFDKIMASLGDGISEDQKQQIMTQVEQSFGEKGLRGSMETFMKIYPDKPVKVGESWTSNATISSTTDLDMSSTYTLKEVTDEYYVITMKADLGAQEVQQFSGANIKMEGTMTGTLNVNRETGWIQSGNMEQNITGETKMPANEMNPEGSVIPMKIKGEITFE